VLMLRVASKRAAVGAPGLPPLGDPPGVWAALPAPEEACKSWLLTGLAVCAYHSIKAGTCSGLAGAML
jgi:hypothetical protein